MKTHKKSIPAITPTAICSFTPRKPKNFPLFPNMMKILFLNPSKIADDVSEQLPCRPLLFALEMPILQVLLQEKEVEDHQSQQNKGSGTGYHEFTVKGVFFLFISLRIRHPPKRHRQFGSQRRWSSPMWGIPAILNDRNTALGKPLINYQAWIRRSAWMRQTRQFFFLMLEMVIGCAASKISCVELGLWQIGNE